MKNDGIHSMVNYEDMTPSAKKMRDFYNMKPNAGIYQREFGYYCLDRWESEGHIKHGEDLDKLFQHDVDGWFKLRQLGWDTASFNPQFETKVLEDRDKHEVVQDFAGRKVLCFKNRRSGFMPEYIDHPVKDIKTWEENCKWRLQKDTQDRYPTIEKELILAKKAAGEGRLMVQHVIGGYMYLRSLIGPLELLYKFYDEPELIHSCMQTWLELSDAIIARHQEEISLDEIFFGEDICYNKGPLISGDMMKEFLFPYYQQLFENARKRQLDKNRKIHFQLDTDGFSDTIIDLYNDSIGLDHLSPFEVASNCDVVRTGKEYPELRISGGFDKRILALNKDAIDREIERIMPVMKMRGGYTPTCDHGVPEEVSFENYMHYRKRMLEYAK